LVEAALARRLEATKKKEEEASLPDAPAAEDLERVLAQHSGEVEAVMVEVELAEAAKWLSPPRFLQQMEVERQLDCAIDRAVKRLLQLKSMKPMFGLATPSRASPAERVAPRPLAIAAAATT
jgi:hypothetical protein